MCDKNRNNIHTCIYICMYIYKYIYGIVFFYLFIFLKYSILSGRLESYQLNRIYSSYGIHGDVWELFSQQQ